ncbi:TonB-dependent receptor domain-containing protein [Asaia bogorensis]|nr:TonB-dependent receptor [Asaia bogorensis]
MVRRVTLPYRHRGLRQSTLMVALFCTVFAAPAEGLAQTIAQGAGTAHKKTTARRSSHATKKPAHATAKATSSKVGVAAGSAGGSAAVTGAGTAPQNGASSAAAQPALPFSSGVETADSSPQKETIIVTGTRLSQSRLTNVMAGSTLGGEQIRRRGYYDLGTALLRENPAISQGGNSTIGNQGSFGAGQSFIGLLNLGAQRTLTLIDGMRMGGGATASIYGAGSGSQVDVSTIPTSLIKGIDTRLGGAGAAYGADAVAGVMNYTLDDHFTGVDFNAQGNWSQKLDAPGEKLTFKAGRNFDHDKGGMVFDVEYRNQGGMVANDRPDVFGRDAVLYHRVPLGQSSPYTYVLGAGSRFIQNSVTGIPMITGDYGNLPVYAGSAGAALAGQANNAVANAANMPLMFSQNGQSLIPLQANAYLKGDTTHGIGGNGIALQDYNQLIAPNDKLNLTLLGHYDITRHIHATWQGWYARGSAESQVGQGTWSTTQFDNPLTLNTAGPMSSSYYTNDVVNGAYALSTSNPYLTSAEQQTIKNALAANGQPTDTFYLNRLNQDLDAGLYRTKVQMYRFQGGLAGDFNAVGRKFDWKVRGEYTRYMNDTWTPSIVIPNLVNALNAVRDSSGNIVCASGYQNAPIATRSSTCEPLNPFGYNQMTPGARDYVISDAHSRNNNTQRDIQAELSSTVFRLPAGDIRWDLGYEHRREGYHFDPGAFFRGWPQGDGTYQQYGNSTAIPPTGGAYHTHEAFGELDVPFVSPTMNVPGIYNLSATANGRFINNSMTGNYWTYMFGGAWWPTEDFGLSGNYAQSVRNPSVTELFSPRSTDYESGVDPCSDAGVGSGPNPAIRAANCAKAGITQPFTSNFNFYTIPGSAGGNSNLKNETSKSYTGSLEFRPHFVRGLDMKASFVDVKVKNAITSLGAQDLMNACYDSSSYPSNAFCNTFTRDSSGQLSTFSAGYYNIASYETQALQATFDYYAPLSRFGLGDGAGEIDLSGNYVHYLKSQNTYLGSTYFLSGTTDAPNDNFTLNLNYMRGPFSAQWQTLWYGPTQYAVQVPATRYQDNKRPSFAYFNLSLAYEITKNLAANFVINNITDALPKDPGIYDTNRYYEAFIGRSFQLNIGVHF